MGKKVGSIFAGILCAFLAILLLADVYLLLARKRGGYPTVFGWSSAVVLSGSMEPTFYADDLLILHSRDTYAVGDVVLFIDDGIPVTHRIVVVTPEGYRTQGDANNVADDPIPASAVKGRVVLVIPGVGAGIRYLRSGPGIACLLLVLAAVGVWCFLPDRKKKDP